MKDKNLSDEEIKKRIIFSLHRGSYYNSRHTPKKNLCKRLSSIPCKKIIEPLRPVEVGDSRAISLL